MQFDPDFTPLSFQSQGCEEIIRLNGRALLADEMGLGKTIQAIMYMDFLDKYPVVICCPAGVKSGWESEIYKIIGVRAIIAEGRIPPRDFAEQHKNAIVIINYELLGHWQKIITLLRPKLIVLDECQNLTNRKTIRSKAAKIICKRVPHVLGLSGTPLVNRPSELWVILNIIWPSRFKSFVRFAQRYCDPKYIPPWGWNYKGASNVVELHALLKEVGMIRRLKKRVMKDLPKKSREMHFVHMRNRADYAEAERNFAGWLKKHKPQKSMKARQAAALVRLGALRMLCAKYKAKSVVEWINNWLDSHDSAEKLVVFAWHKKMLDVLENHINCRLVRIDGGTPLKMRRVAIEQFRKTKATRVVIANLQAAGTGVDGLQIAQEMAIVEFPYRPGDLNQCEARIDRIGQANASVIHYLVTEATVEEDLCKLLQKKQSTVASVLDGQIASEDDFELLELLMDGIAQRSQHAVTRAVRKARH